jgi:hypothetical protein
MYFFFRLIRHASYDRTDRQFVRLDKISGKNTRFSIAYFTVILRNKTNLQLRAKLTQERMRRIKKNQSSETGRTGHEELEKGERKYIHRRCKICSDGLLLPEMSRPDPIDGD